MLSLKQQIHTQLIRRHTTHSILGLSDNGVNHIQSWDLVLCGALRKGGTSDTHNMALLSWYCSEGLIPLKA